ncbi:MAG: type IV pilus secretin PilQ [Oceanobacter sp.]
MRICFRAIRAAVLLMLVQVSASAFAVNLMDISFASLPGDVTEVRLDFDGTPPDISGYTIEKPARIAIDMPGAVSALSAKKHPIGTGNARSAFIVGTKDRVRLVINLAKMVPYTTQPLENALLIRVGAESVALFHAEERQRRAAELAQNSDQGAETTSPHPPATKSALSAGMKIVNVDFRRGELGDGQVQLMLNSSKASANIRREGSRIIADLEGVYVPPELKRRLDVMDFATPVQFIDVNEKEGNARIVIEPVKDEFEYLAYQTDKLLSINVTDIVEEAQDDRNKKFPFTGEKLSLNFQDIEVRAVLQLIADFTGLNLVASDTVAGSITLRLQNVPWDQALDLVLKTKGLGKRQMGTVLLIAPAAEIAAREKIELEAVKQAQELAPLVQEFVQFKYAKAADLANILSSDQGLLSERGSAVVDERTNTILMKDTAENLEKIREALSILDVPVRQVLIEARIVVATTNVGEEMGVKWGGSYYKNNGSNWVTAGGSQQTIADANQILFDRATGEDVDGLSLSDADIVDFGATSASATTFAVGYQAADYLLDLELSAIETDGRAEVVSQPRVITADGQTAFIESGQQIPYEEATSSGATSVTFKDAVLRLEVTPQITPDDRIIMDLSVSQDSVGEATDAGPSINTNSVETQVLVNNGETVVLGGIFQSSFVKTTEKTPFFGDLPLIGALFRYTYESEDKAELLIFITPRLIDDSFISR